MAAKSEGVPAAQGPPQALLAETALDGTQEAAPSSPALSLASAGGVSVRDAKQVENMDWAELRTTPTMPYCNSCGLVPKTVMKEAVRKKGHQKLMCQSCSNVSNMLYKRVSMADIGFRDLEKDQAQ